MAFADQTHRLGSGVQHGRQNIVILGGSSGAFGHAKGGHHGAGLGRIVEKSAVGRVRPGPTAFDVIHTQFIQSGRDTQLFLGRKLHTLGLLTIPQGGVVEVEAIFDHLTGSSAWSGSARPGVGVKRPPMGAGRALPGQARAVQLRGSRITNSPISPHRNPAPAQAQHRPWTCALQHRHQ